MELIYDDKTGTWGEAPEAYGTIECATKEDYEYAKKAIKGYKELEAKHWDECRQIAHYDDEIKRLKAADQTVKLGRWIETHISLCKWIPEDEKEEGHSFYMAELKCSCCERYNVVTFALTLNKPDFCQLCGARMDGDKE